MDLAVLIPVLLVVALSFFFDFTNGFHDTANAMATSVATGALKPRVAVLISAVLNLVGAFLSTAVAKTVSEGILAQDSQGLPHITVPMIFAGLMGAVLWNLLTWWLGLPSSSTHALFGGLIGAAVIGAGFSAVEWGGVVSKIVLPALLSPFIAGSVALVATYLVYRVTRMATVAGSTTAFRHGQTVSASLVSLAHGTNDVGLYTAGIRLLAVGAPDIRVGADGDPEGLDAVAPARVGTRPVAASIGGFACFAGFAAAVLVGVYLVIPAFHGH